MKKNLYSSIFDLCHCGCGEIVWNGRRYINGHNSRGNTNPSKNLKVRKKISKSKIGKKRPDMMGNNNPAKRPEVREKIRKNHTRPRKGKYNSQNWKKIMSKKFSGKSNPSYGNPQYHGKRYYYESPLQGKIYLRSTYELAYAQYLDSQKILWYYEIETFELNDEMTYTPDFFLPQLEKFIEVKGYMSSNAQNKINKFKEEYPFDLEILYKEDLTKLGIDIE